MSGTLPPPPLSEDSVEEARIRERVRYTYTGNRTHDLAVFTREEFKEADAEWHREAQRRYEKREVDRRIGIKQT